MTDIDVTDVENEKTQAQVVAIGGENPPRHCNRGDNGALRRVLVENSTNVRMTRHAAWERVM